MVAHTEHVSPAASAGLRPALASGHDAGMDTATHPSIPSVRSELNYVAAGETAPKVISDSGGAPPRYTGNYAWQPLEIFDGRAAERLGAETFSLEVQGFELRRHLSATASFENDADITGTYYPEIIDLVKDATGADRVEIFDHTVRKDGNQVGRQPARHVHVDYTERSGPQRIRDILGDAEAERLFAKRHIQINVWRSIADAPVVRSPLAFADARTVRPDDLIPTSILFPHSGRTGEIYGLRQHPEQRWFYYPEMTKDEAVLIKSFDSLTDGRARFTPHSAFEHPATPADAPPRESIEVRTFAFFD